MERWRRWRGQGPVKPAGDDRDARLQAGVLIASKLAHGRELAAAFSDEAFEAIWFAAEGKRPIDTGDLLRGIASVPDSLAARTLGSLGLGPEVVRAAIEHAGPEPGPNPAEPYRASASAGRVLELAAQEAAARREASFGTADLLIAAVRERDGVAGRALRSLGLSEARLRHELERGKRPTEQ